MKRLLLAAALAAAAASAGAADVGVSLNFAQPGLYGRIDIGSFPRPALIYAEPIVVQPMPYGVVRQPIYLHVPPGHAKNWRKHCARYNACGQPVYFVQDRWYNDVYVPRHRELASRGGPRHERQERYERHDRYDGDRDERRGGGRNKADRDDRGQGRGHDRGPGRDHDRGNGRGKD